MATRIRQGVRPWKYNGRTVQISRTAEVVSSCRPGQAHAMYVQWALTGLANQGEGTVFTVRNLPVSLPLAVVSNDDRKPFWAIHVNQTARSPRFSPFVVAEGAPETTNKLTVQVAVSRGDLMIVRAYAGEPFPPLSWQASAGDAVGGVDACVDYWREHSDVYIPNLTVGSRASGVPDWFRN